MAAAARDPEQPDFQAMAISMNNIVRSSGELATQLSRFPNSPAFDGGALVLAEVRAMREEMGRRFESMEKRHQAA